jgi:methionyl-tRNA formyltransferase
LRTVFLGTSEFAAGVLHRLAGSEHRPLLVITRPDRPQGRGRKLASPAVAQRAQGLGIPVSQPQSVNAPEVLEQIEQVNPQALLVCAFGALIREPLLSSHLMLNVHPSLLPRWRGAAPIERAIIAGDDRTGVCIMRLTAGLDSGPVCMRAQEPIDSHDDYGSLAKRLCELGAELLVAALDRMRSGPPLEFEEQDDSLATYAEKIEAADRLLRPDQGARELERVVRALHPHIGARIELDQNVTLGVLRAVAVPARQLGGAAGAGEEAQTRPLPPAPGALGGREGRLLYGLAGGEALQLLEVQPAGGRPMDAQAYMRGHAL